MPASRTALEGALAAHGLCLRGGWLPTPHDALPELPAGAAAAVVWMVGQVGSACWRAFSGSRFFADGQPCLQACPVQPFGPGSYDVPACADHLHRPEGAQCMQHGCLARRACPVAAALRYEPAHAAFHMKAFAQRHC